MHDDNPDDPNDKKGQLAVALAVLHGAEFLALRQQRPPEAYWIYVKNHRISLGVFSSRREAALAYCKRYLPLEIGP